jgi:hypothetical protein
MGKLGKWLFDVAIIVMATLAIILTIVLLALLVGVAITQFVMLF